MREKHRHFVDAYLTHGNASQAAVEAGYSPNRARQTGRELLRRPDVSAAIKVAQSERAERLGVDADWIVESAVKVYQKAYEGAPQTYHGEPIVVDGVTLVDWHPGGAIGALNTLIKVLGLGPPDRKVVEYEGEIVYTLRVDDRPDAIDVTPVE